MKIRVGLVLVAVMALTGCGMLHHFGKKTPPEQQTLMKSLTGEIEYSLAQPLPSDAYIQVVLSDVSQQDAPSRVVSQERITPVGASPVEFQLTYDPADLKDGVDFAVSARLQQGDRLLALNDERVSVLGRSGNSGAVLIVLKETP
jgi:putative lipoprotein